jgi:hypothetical protein
MNSILAGIVAALLIAVSAAYVLDTNVQQPVDVARSTGGVRL